MTIDAITLGSVWRSLTAVANDAGNTLARTAYSTAVREGRDFSVALFDRHGQMIVQGDFSPGHIGSMPWAVNNILGVYPEGALRPGDAVLFNDPWLGSGHLPDFLLTSPIFLGDQLVGYIVTCTHMIDVGGAVPGSQAVEGIKEVFQEGLRLTPVRMWTEGRRVQELHDVLRANVRVPDTLLGDLQAMRGCNLAGERALLRLVERVGLDVYREACDEILNQSEKAMRESIAEMPEGVAYTAEDFMDDCGPNTDPLRFAVTITAQGGEILVDFNGSSPQTASGINAVANYTRAYTYFVLKTVTHGPALPQNAGSLRPIRWKAPEGSIVNATEPVGVGARAIMQQRIVDVLMMALSDVWPERIVAPSSHWSNPTLGGTDPRSGKRFVFYDVIVGGFGGRHGLDGVEAMSASFNVDGIPAETNEHSYPLIVERYELIPDSAGAGLYRGGHGIRKDVRVLADDVRLSALGDRHRFAPPGVFGGGSGGLATTEVISDGVARRIESKTAMPLANGDTISFRLSGGAGWGNPHARDPKAVRADIDAGLLSAERALQVYGYDQAKDDE